MEQEAKIIVVEGIQGAGKSTFCKSYAACNKNVVVMEEWVDEEFLEKYLHDMKKHATVFQFRAQEETIKKMLRAEELVKEGKTVLIDRGIYGNYVFCVLQYQKGYISDGDLVIYQRVMEKFKLSVPIETWMLYCPPETALARIHKRNRPGEDTYTLEYLQKLNTTHQALIPFNKMIDVTKTLKVSSEGLIELGPLENMLTC